MTNETGIAPAILRLYPRLDAGQRELIRRLEGPVLGIAGPGAGKTLSVALRAANILLLGKAEPSELLLCTYNADAAVELRQRLDAVGRAAGYDGRPPAHARLHHPQPVRAAPGRISGAGGPEARFPPAG